MPRHMPPDLGEIGLAGAGLVDELAVEHHHQTIRQFQEFVEVLADQKHGGAAVNSDILCRRISSRLAWYRSPRMRISPLSASRWPARTSTSCRWPLPETPAMPTISPPRTESETLWTATAPASSSAFNLLSS